MEGVGQFVAFLEAQGMPTDVASITREYVELWLLSLREAGKSHATVANRYRSLAIFFEFCVQEGEISDSPMRKIPTPKITQQKVAVVLDDDELRALFKACAGKAFVDERDHSLLRFMVDTGCRRAEVLSLTGDNLDLLAGMGARGGQGPTCAIGGVRAQDGPGARRVPACS